MSNIQNKINTLNEKGEAVQLHLGCGKRNLPGFLHFDKDPDDHIDRVGNVDQLEDIQDDCCDLIYACHILEYFDQDQVKSVLKDWSRVLKPGGILRLSVPDFNKVIKIHHEYNDMKLLYGFLYGRYRRRESDDYIYHRMIYTEQSLTSTLLENGFSSTGLYKWEDTIHKDHDDYSQAYIPHMDKENGTLMSINMEAIK